MIIILFLMSCTATNPPVDSSKTTPGNLSVSTLTSSAGGPYSPRNVLAIWVETSSGKFVKTLLVYAAERKPDLTNFMSNSAGNATDAITGATLSSHATRTCTWNGKDTAGNLVANGNYKLCIELSDTNGTGTFKSVSFAKDTIATSQTPGNMSCFSNISIKWTPN